MVLYKVCVALARRVGVPLLGGMIFWQVAKHSGSTDGQIIVHVTRPQVHVVVDGVKYWVEDVWHTPIVCDLRPGRHQVSMLRNGRVLYQEEFTLAAGEERILTAWDGYTDGRSPKPAD